MEINVHRFVPAVARIRKLTHRLPFTRISRLRVATSAILGLAGALAVAGVALAAPRSPFSPASPQAQQIENIFIFVLVIAGLIGVGVEGVIIYSSIAHRARPGRQPATFRGNAGVEIAWTVIPALLLLIVFVLTVQTMHAVTNVPSDPLVIRVVAHQFWWEFDYPNSNIVTANEMHVPVGEQVIIQLESADVIHSFWVPQLAGKSDANPGHVNQVTFTVTAPGVYEGQCSEFCGVEHAWMLIRVVAQTPADYNAWVAAQRQPAVPPAGGLAAQGQQLFQSEACGSCHAINGTSANGIAGPNLTHVASRATIGSGVLANTPSNMDRWLTDPQAVKPGILMPNFKFTPDQIKALTAYMETLR